MKRSGLEKAGGRRENGTRNRREREEENEMLEREFQNLPVFLGQSIKHSNCLDHQKKATTS